MSLLQKTIILCLLAVKICADDKISFKNVEIEFSEEVVDVTSSANLKTYVLPGDREARVHGAVPILYEDSVADLQGFQYLQLDNISLREIRPGAFRNLTSQTISVKNNNIQLLQEDTFSDIDTHSLDLRFNSISTLQSGVFKHSTICYLSFLGNKISKIPKGLFANVSIKGIRFDDNNLCKIEDGAFLGIQRQELKELFFPYNKLEEIDPETFDFPNLQILDLNYNRMKVIRPGDLKNLPELKYVGLQSNRLKEIADGVFSHSKINWLDLSFNEITSVSSGAFENMTELISLAIIGNNLTKWDANWFRNSPKLFFLHFESNKIEQIPDNAFQNLRSLFYLLLQNNEIAKISSNLGTNFSIKNINLNNNKLKCIEGDLQEIFRNVVYVDLYGNHWDDSCQNKVSDYSRRSESIGMTDGHNTSYTQ